MTKLPVTTREGTWEPRVHSQHPVYGVMVQIHQKPILVWAHQPKQISSCAALARLKADKLVYKSWSHVFMSLSMTYVYTIYTCHIGVSPWQPIPLIWVGPGILPPACLPLICHRNTLNIGCFKSLKLLKALCSVLLVWLSYLHSAFLFSFVAFGRVYF